MIDSFGLAGRLNKCLRFNGKNSTEKIKKTIGFWQLIWIRYSTLFRSRHNSQISIIISENTINRDFDYNQFAYENDFNTLILKKTIEKKLGKPYNDCLEDFSSVDENSLVSKTIKFNNVYNRDKRNKL